MEIKTRSLIVFSRYFVFRRRSSSGPLGCPVWRYCLEVSAMLAETGRLDLTLYWRSSEDQLKRPCSIWSGSRVLLSAEDSVALVVESKLAGRQTKITSRFKMQRKI